MVGIISAILTAVSHVLIRSLRLTEHPLVIVNYYGYIIGSLSLGTLLLQRNFIFPDTLSLFILFLLGFFGLVGQYTLAKAYQLAPAKLVSLYMFSEIIFGTCLAILFFKEIPDIISILGAATIVTSGYLNYKYVKKEE